MEVRYQKKNHKREKLNNPFNISYILRYFIIQRCHKAEKENLLSFHDFFLYTFSKAFHRTIFDFLLALVVTKFI